MWFWDTILCNCTAQFMLSLWHLESDFAPNHTFNRRKVYKRMVAHTQKNSV